MDGEIGGQLLQPVFPADQLDRLGQGECGRQQLVGDRLRNHIGNADAERMHARAGPVQQGLLEFGANGKNLVGVGQRGMPGIGQFQPASAAAEQRDPQAVFQYADLPGQRLRCQMQLFGRLVDGAGLGDGTEVVQVLVIEHDVESIR